MYKPYSEVSIYCSQFTFQFPCDKQAEWQPSEGAEGPGTQAVLIGREYGMNDATTVVFFLMLVKIPPMSHDTDLNQRLAEQYAEIAQLAGGLAHEIKNPLSTIRMNMELLAEDFRESDASRDRRAMKKIELVQRECSRLQELLDHFLQFAKANRLNLQPSDLNGLVRQILDFYRPKARQSGVEIADYLAGSLPTVLLDREAFHGAILNLLLNAEQAMPGGGQLVVRTFGTPDGVAVELIDTGSGMDDETRKKVFDAFFSTKRGGSGLGLPTVRKIVEGHGGRIRLQSEPGRGTQVTIQLPVPRRLPADGKL
jgi:two-component system, NtrC family, sensor histidine kinase HydH